MKNAFRLQYGDKTDPRFLLSEFENIKKNPNESVHDFNTRFNKTLRRLPVSLRPCDASCLIKYVDAFDKKAAYYLRDKNPTNLRQAFTMALQIENNIKAIGKPLKRDGVKLINPEKPQASKGADLEEVVKTLAGAVKEISYKLARAEKGIGKTSQGQPRAQNHDRFSNHPRGDQRVDDRGKGPMGSANRHPQAREGRVLPDPLTARVAVVEEVADIDWCDRCFLPHPPCEVDQQEGEANNDDGTDDDICMMGCSSSPQGGATSTEVISARTAATFWDCIKRVQVFLPPHTLEVDVVQAFEIPNNDFEYLRALMIKKYDGGIPSEEDRQLLMNVVVAQEKDYNTRSKVVKGVGPQAKPKTPLLTSIPKEAPRRETLAKSSVVPRKNYSPPHAQAAKNPMPSDESSCLPSNVVFPKSVPYDIAQVLSQIKVSVPIIELLRIPEHKKRAFEYLGLKEEKTTPGRNVNVVEIPPQIIVDLETPPVVEDLGETPEVYLGTSLVDSQLNVDPFFTTLIIKDRLLHNCMFDSGASCNVMPLEVMNELDIKVTTAYGKCTAMDSREVPVVGCVKGLVVQLASYPGRNLKLDVVIVDCPAKWGMLLSRKWAASVGGSVQMDMYFSTIPIEGSLVKLYGEKKMLHLIEDPNNASYEVLFVDVDADNFIGFADGKEHKMDQSKCLE
ncbi:hypothetical protein KI387_023793 [Taxus chinensis]|uniref:Retrotransposon gag domain-containing protein n=2 Tax=Taxus chinensis TaxID=29808 RepID=A0AA38G351_TAXCH|nr:hypothetical protein KI387_023793 [Taxus chinensis]